MAADTIVGWTSRRLGDLLDIAHGFAFEGRYFRDEPTDAILVTPGNFAIGGGFKSDKLKFYQGPIPGGFTLRSGELIVTMTDLSKDGDTLGFPALVPSLKGYRLLHNQRIGKVNIHPGAPLDVRFAYYRLCTSEYRHEVLATATGSTVRHTSPGRIANFRFPLPPLIEQRAIAGILGALDDKIELNRKTSETLEAIARALFKSWFVDFDPVRAKIGRQLDAMDADTAALFPDSFEASSLGPIPKGWRVRRLAELTSKIGSGSTPTGGSSVYVDEGPAFIRSQNVYDSYFVWDGLVRLDPASVARLRGVSVQPKDVLLNITGDSILRTCVVDDDVLPAHVNQHVAIIRPQPAVLSRYIHFHLLRAETKLALLSMDTGATRPAVTKAHLQALPLLVPSNALLERFDQLVGPLFRRVHFFFREARTLTAMRTALLPKLMSGDVRVLVEPAFDRELGPAQRQ